MTLSTTPADSTEGSPQPRARRQYKNLPFDPHSSSRLQAKYADKTIVEMDAARNAIDAQIAEVANPILTEILKSGGGTKIGADTGQLTMTSADSREVSMTYVNHGVGVFRATLPRDEYPDIYELKEESLWLEYAITGRFRQAASGQPSDNK